MSASAEDLGEAVEQVRRAELEEGEQLADLVGIGLAEVQVGRLDVDGGIAHQLHDLDVLAHLRLVLGEVGAQLRGLLVEVLVDAVDAAVRVDQLGRRSSPTPGTPGRLSDASPRRAAYCT